MDRTNALEFAQVQDMPFNPYAGMLSKGYSESTLWIKLAIKASDEPLVLRIRPTFTDEIQLFEIGATSVIRKSGDTTSWSTSEIPALGLNFRLQASSQDKTFYLKVKSGHSYLLYVEAITIPEYLKANIFDDLVYSAYIIFLFVIALWITIAWLMHRDQVLGFFTVHQWFAFTHAFLILGFGRYLLEPAVSADVLNVLDQWIIVIFPIVAILANRVLLKEYGLKKSYQYIFNFLIVACLIVLLLKSMGHRALALETNAQLVLITTFFSMVASIWGVRHTDASTFHSLAPIKFLRTYYILVFVVWMIAILPLLGIIQGTELSIHALYIYNVLCSCMLYGFLQYRNKYLFLYELNKSNFLTNQIEQERIRHEEQSKLMDMLTHEIKTPLSVLKLIVDQQLGGSDAEVYANRAVKNIDSIINRCLQLDKLDANAIHPFLVPCDLQRIIDALLFDISDSQRIIIKNSVALKIQTDPEILKIILTNLLENAVKYSNQTSTIDFCIQVVLKNKQQGIEFLVTNEISVFGTPDVNQLYKKYYRNPSATKVSGTGVGLFLIRELAKTLNGTVECHTTQHHITFGVWIPV